VEQVQDGQGNPDHDEGLPVGQAQCHTEHQNEGRTAVAGQGGPLSPAAGAVVLIAFCFDEEAGHHRIDDDGHEQGTRKGDDEGEWHVAHKLPDDSGPQEHGPEGRHRGGSGGDHRASHLRGSQSSGLPSRVSLLAEAIDVLNHHHCIVHQHPQGNDQGKQDNEVQSVPESLKDQERGKHRQGNGNTDENRIPDPEEEKQDRNDEDETTDNVIFQVRHQGLHVLALIARDEHLSPTGKIKLVEGGLDLFGGFQNVRPGPLGDVERNHLCGAAFRLGYGYQLLLVVFSLEDPKSRETRSVFEPEHHVGHVANVDISSILCRLHHQLFDLVGRTLKLTVHPDKVIETVDVNRSAGNVRVFVLDCGG